MTVAALVDDLFRRSSSQLTAALVRVVGPERLDLAEEAVQDAMVRALETWSYRGVPQNPQGWLFQVARNRALDLLRRDASLDEKIALQMHDLAPAPEGSGRYLDDELAMIFMACDPRLTRDAQIALTLKAVGGFSVKEIAAAFLAEPSTIAQRLVRAKRELAEGRVAFELPDAQALTARLDAVLEVVYLLFTEGHNAHAGEQLVRAELCGEAIRLARLLAADARTSTPVVHALLALMLFQASRLSARTDAAGDLLLLDQQNRADWDWHLITEGLHHLERASHGEQLTPFHIQAAIAAGHVTAPNNAETDWGSILEYYDQLLQLAPTPVVQLNRAIALARLQGARAGLESLHTLSSDPALDRYYLYHAAMGGLWLELHEGGPAAQCYERALSLCANAPERRFLSARLAHARETVRAQAS